MIIALDHDLLHIQDFEKVLNILGEKNLLCSMEENLCKYSVNWYRKVINISTENGEVSFFIFNIIKNKHPIFLDFVCAINLNKLLL